MGDTRRWPRLHLALDVRIRFDNLEQAVDTTTLNLSRGGLFIRMAAPREIGTRVRIGMRIASTREQFTLEGVVIRRVPDGDEPLRPGDIPGVAVFLTSTSVGYARFCENLVRQRAVQEMNASEFEGGPTDPMMSGPVVEAVRPQAKPR